MSVFIKVRIMANGSYFDCYQQRDGDNITAYVKEGGEEISPVIEGVGTPGLPNPHECMVLDPVEYEAPKKGARPAWLALREDAKKAI